MSRNYKRKGDDQGIITYINSLPVYGKPNRFLSSNADLRSRAVALRKMGNLPEIIFWKQVHKGKFHNLDFDRQKVIGNYIVDFYVKRLWLVVEIDGSSHDFKEEYDMKREHYLIDLGLKIYRIGDIRMKEDTGNVMRELEDFITKEFGDG